MDKWRYILFIIVALLYKNVVAQDIYDYRYYKLFEDEIPTILEQKDTTDIIPTIPIKIQSLPTLFDYNFSATAFSRRGVKYSERKAYFEGIEIQNSLNSYYRLQLGRIYNASMPIKSNIIGTDKGIVEYKADSIENEQTSLALIFSSRSLPYGISLHSAHNLSHGWSLRSGLYARTGKDLHIGSIFGSQVATNIIATKKWNGNSKLSLLFSFAPSSRSTRTATYAEAIKNSGDKLYNPSWGYQNGKVRSSNIRSSYVPSAIISYCYTPQTKTSISTAFGIRYGKEKYSFIDWLNSPSPLPDNRRNLPSYYTDSGVADFMEQQWANGSIAQIDFDRLCHLNRINGSPVYVMADRVTRVLNLQYNLLFTTKLDSNNSIIYGVNCQYNNSRNYKCLTDLLGGQPFADIDYYIIDDDSYSNLMLNDLRNPYRKITKGSRYGYDYSISHTKASANILFSGSYPRFSYQVGGQIDYSFVSRNGHYQKELFKDNSYGRSHILKFSPYSIRGSFSFHPNENHIFNFVVGGGARDIDDNSIFLNGQYNNRIIPKVDLERYYSAEISYKYLTHKVLVGITAFARYNGRGTEIHQLYDDISATYADMVVSGIDRLYYGAEVELYFKLVQPLSLKVVGSFGSYKYCSNARVSIYQDSDNHLLCDRSKSLIKGYRVGNSPEYAASGELNYFNKGWGANISLNYCGGRYIAPSFSRRSVRVVEQSYSVEQRVDFMRQEKLDDIITADLSLSKTIFLSRADKKQYINPLAPRFIDNYPKARITIFVGIRNLFGKSDIVYSGYESSRLRRQTLAGQAIFTADCSRYLYSYPRTYYLSLRFTF